MKILDEEDPGPGSEDDRGLVVVWFGSGKDVG